MTTETVSTKDLEAMADHAMELAGEVTRLRSVNQELIDTVEQWVKATVARKSIEADDVQHLLHRTEEVLARARQ